MTENEARLILDVRISRFDHARDVNEALEIAKQALKEIQLYKDNKLCLIPKDSDKEMGHVYTATLYVATGDRRAT